MSDLSPTEFENLTYDLLQLMGINSLVWRTPGSDGGRDIEGVHRSVDFSGGVALERWYVECKRYGTSVDWPTLWKKLAYADAANADFLLLVTTSNPSPQAETEITKWNTQRGVVKLRVWRGYDLDRILGAHPSLTAKYGLRDSSQIVGPEFLPLAVAIMKISQANYVADAFETDFEPGLEAAAALSELVTFRLENLRQYGWFIAGTPCTAAPDYQWLDWTGPVGSWDDTGLRAVLTYFRYAVGGGSIRATTSDDGVELVSDAARCDLTAMAVATLRDVAIWSRAELQAIDTAERRALIAPQRS
ncbi:MAG TPA: restriction endonuclease [Allosphingosinicella sp.]|nr:restriction endonuclease [Allosphingosinicella sp.]